MASEPNISEVIRRIEKIEQKDIDQDSEITQLRIETAVLKVKVALYAAAGASVPSTGAVAIIWWLVKGA